MWKGKYKIGLRGKIFFVNIFLLVLTFLLIGGVTFYNFNKQNTEYHISRLKRKEKSILKELEYHLLSIGKYIGADETEVYLKSFVERSAYINNLELNIYHLNGELLLLSDSCAYRDKIFPRSIPNPWKKQILEEGRFSMAGRTLDEKKYLSEYLLIRNKRKDPLCILHIPYYDLEIFAKRDLRDFLKDVLASFVPLLLISLLMAFLLSRIITIPLKTLSENLRHLKLSGKKTPLSWEVKDEIGMLIAEYNTTLAKLEESALQLSRQERAVAWREMAKQVAHEIKNPLTPMRLNVQYFAKNFTDLSKDQQEDIREFCDSLLEQIDHMNHIAEAFSNFAELPAMEMGKVAVNSVLGQIDRLYAQRNIQVNYCPENCKVQADPKQLHQVFLNIVKNGYHAAQEMTDTPMVSIYASSSDDEVTIKISDNGPGIPSELAEKIFEPKFTTKDSGKGLGLAMVKNIIDAHCGTIEIEKNRTEGATFVIHLPKINELS